MVFVATPEEERMFDQKVYEELDVLDVRDMRASGITERQLLARLGDSDSVHIQYYLGCYRTESMGTHDLLRASLKRLAAQRAILWSLTTDGKVHIIRLVLH